ncbi:MAG TPA: hypothetical protein VHB74_08580 [Devosia sp.]|nr:hypothetical protein [Devosia sp.]
MPDEETTTPQPRLPVPAGKPDLSRRPAGPVPAAAFLSQLIAERDRLAPQRARRRAPLGTALASYGSTARQAIRRLPPGYRTALTV